MRENENSREWGSEKCDLGNTLIEGATNVRT